MKVKFITLGCKVNQYETQALVEEFSFRGYELTEEAADLYVVNTCSVTKRADVKSKEAVSRAKKENPAAKIVICGCSAKDKKYYFDKSGVDLVIPQDKKHALVDIVLGKPLSNKDIWSLKISSFFNHRAFVKIQDGCDNFCSFCKIPYLRGRSRSRLPGQIIEEIERVSQKHKEIVLCGVNLGLYGKDLVEPQSLENLLERILKISFLGRLRFSSLEPLLITDKLLSFLNHPKVCPHLHLPFQSGDDGVLAAMNKKERVIDYEAVVAKARDLNPEIAISCDIMVGFPAEDNPSFYNTVEFLKRTRPMRMHIFRFSPRQYTAFSETRIANSKETHNRMQTLKKLAEEFSKEYRQKFLGRTLSMVAEEKKEGLIWGYADNYIRVCTKDDIALGEIATVKIEKIDNARTCAIKA
ncbi:MAG: tRNA (N(6)-L-threonylcarbamoyladenosine(37)-C(2))-methylthiotransferase MtaB [Candidatus Omnitrophota bacterium]|nr:MAG: tRNA (N(6)-L-threonylcarbamoyladenosine(37)-C(2))-methylthiotransferase MtaB [Candidatus Omnitrophota bacterium]